MSKLIEFKKHIKAGKTYRRAEMEKWSTSVDRHLKLLVDEGSLVKLSAGLYHSPKQSTFGTLPADDNDLIKTFLKDDDFLFYSLNDYNKLGVGTTQLYNKRIVYNHRRHGRFTLGNKDFHFHSKPKFPKEATEEFLLVDLVNNIDSLAEDTKHVLENILAKAQTLNKKRLTHSIKEYGTVRAKKIFAQILQKTSI
jgi:hypothetical protein